MAVDVFQQNLLWGNGAEEIEGGGEQGGVKERKRLRGGCYLNRALPAALGGVRKRIVNHKVVKNTESGVKHVGGCSIVGRKSLVPGRYSERGGGGKN